MGPSLKIARATLELTLASEISVKQVNSPRPSILQIAMSVANAVVVREASRVPIRAIGLAIGLIVAVVLIDLLPDGIILA